MENEDEFDDSLETAIDDLAALMSGRSKKAGPVVFRSKDQVLAFLKDARIPGHTPEEAFDMLIEKNFIALSQ